MRKQITFLMLFLCFSIAWAQNQKPITTQFYPGLIQLNQPIHISEISATLNNTFGLNQFESFTLLETKVDDAGFTHYKYQHLYKGLVVDGSIVKAHTLNGFVQSISGSYRSFPMLVTNPSISEAIALSNALNEIGANQYVWQQNQSSVPKADLVVFTHPRSHITSLAYKFDVYAVDPLYRADVYVDAQSGKVLFENNKIHHTNVSASGNSLYNGNVSFTADNTGGSNYRLRQTANGNGIETYDMNNGTNYGNSTDFTSSNANSWSDATGVQAHYGAEQTHNYFQNSHSRNSFDGNGAVIRSYVHYSSNYVNAFWDGQRMTYGDGDGVNYGPLVSLDIVAHEITHGVTNYAANLVYSYESGALNESFSDIFGEAIEAYATGNNNWQMGTDIGIGGSGAIRSMDNPNAFGDPDTYGGTYWYTGTGDNGGVHINSGVQNKWFHILVEGENGTNDLGNSYNITGIGMNKAARIAYRNLTVYLSTNSQYNDARNGAIQSAIDLFGAGSAEVIATTNAWYAVGVGGLYGTISYCNSSGNNSSYEWISNVALGSFSNNSGASGYSDFTSQTVNVNAGQAYSVTLTPGFSGTVYQEYWKVWIDYNADGDFSDAGEEVFSGGPSSSAVSGSISIPTSASGTTRMRVSMKWNASQTACEVFSYGEVEDYTIDISNGGGGDTQPPTAPTNLLASGTTTNSSNLSWNASTDNVGVTGYNVYVDGSLDGTTTGTSYSLSSLNQATSYSVYVTAEDAAGNTSAASNTIVVTTQSLPDLTPPSAPTNITVNNVSQNGADVSWSASSDNVGVTGYDIDVNGTIIGTTVATNYTLSGLSPSTKYRVTIIAKDAAGNTNSDFKSFTTSSAGGGSTVLLGSYFESGWDGWQDGGGDCARYSGTRSWEGTSSVRLRDNSGVASSMTSPTLNLTGYNQIEVEFYFYPNSMENNEDFWLRYYDGNSWSTVGVWARGTSFNNDAFYMSTVTLSSSNHTFPTNAKIRFQCDASGNGDRIYIDAVTVTASNVSSFYAPTGPVQTIKKISSGNTLASIDVEDGSILYPNPASEMISILTEDQPQFISVVNLTGQVVMQIKETEDLSSIDISHLPAGSYVVAIQFIDEIEYIKFIKQ